jgi:hypothetical protein
MITSDMVVVASAKKIPLKTITDGQYSHLGLSYNGSVEVTASIVPDAEVGRYAARNRFGWEVKRTDLPMITKSFSWETPNFGDAATYGTHTHHQDRKVYQVEAFEPRMFPIKIELLNAPGADVALVKFEVGQVLDKTADGFNDDLLFCLNLLQESTGVSEVHASNATREEFIGTTALDWEVFPPGQAEAVIAAMTRGRNGLSPHKAGILAERIKLFNRLPVEQIIRGSGHFDSAYVGALYADDLVVFENMNYGNALYVLYDDWKDVSKRSRLELLRGTTAKFDRVVHTDGWEDRFQTLIEGELKKRGRSPQKRR